MDRILAIKSISMDELRTDPKAVITGAKGTPIAVLEGDQPVVYIVSPEFWEQICDRLEDAELSALAQRRLNNGQAPVEINLADL